MAPQLPAMYDLLFDYAIGRLDEEARRDVERRLREEPGLADELDKIRAILEPLETWAAPPPPANLVDNVLDRIEQRRFPRMVAGSALPPGEGRGVGRRPIISLPELVALAACIMFFVGVFVPSLSRSRYLAKRAQCTANLASIFSGLQTYAQANDGCLPNTGMRTGVNWLQNSPNRRNLHVLVYVRLVRPDAMICPSRPDHQVMPPEQAFSTASLADRRCISYDMQNMAGPTCNLRDRLLIPVVGDANPLFEGGCFQGGVNLREANTVAHRGTGQNVLFADGHREWTTSPVVGSGGDNIWTAGDVTTYEGTEVQLAATDAFLVP